MHTYLNDVFLSTPAPFLAGGPRSRWPLPEADGEELLLRRAGAQLCGMDCGPLRTEKNVAAAGNQVVIREDSE